MSGIAWGDVATWFAGAATAGALVFAALQVRYLKSQVDQEREVALRGVALSWRSTADATSATRRRYEFTLANPGRLPIRDVIATLSFPVAVECLDFHGTKLAASQSLVLDTAVVLGGATRVWFRTLEFAAPGDLEQMRRATCDIEFRDVDRAVHKTSWGRV